MSNNTIEFKLGDVVYHKANNLRMVVYLVSENNLRCSYVNKSGVFEESNNTFYFFEVSHEPASEIPILTQLEYKGIER